MGIRRELWLAGAVAVMSCWGVSCGDSETQSPPSSGGVGGSGAVGGGVGGSGAGGVGGLGFGGSTVECTVDADCNGGVCHDGVCCGSGDLVCGAGCCDAGEVCLFEACVTPGDDCVSEADCPPGHYCEPALGEPGGQGGAGAGCTQPLNPGKCLPLPPVCEGTPSDPPDCVEPCEYHPPVGQLDASIKWQWGYDPAPSEFPDAADVWATPAVARIYDSNCDGKVDLADSPNVVVVSADSMETCCQCNGTSPTACHRGVLRMLDGASGHELWSLDKAEPSSAGFAGLSVAVGDVDQDQRIEVLALTGEGKLAVISDSGVVEQLSTEVIPGSGSGSFGWGGGLAVGDMNHDGWPEIAFCNTVFTMEGGTLSLLFQGSQGTGGSISTCLAHFADLDGNGDLELLAGRTAYTYTGGTLWDEPSYNGFTATGDFDGDLLPEVVVISGGQILIREGSDGHIELGPVALPGSGSGGPPTVADFDGDGIAEIGVAQSNLYSVMEADYAGNTLTVLWSQTNHDMSSSQTGSSVFDFDGDGKAEVVYNDECFLWVYDGQTGDILFTANTQSFTATEATIVADVDGDGHAEIVMGSNGANPVTWTCAHHDAPGVIVAPHTQAFPVWTAPAAGAYRGITVFADVQSSWVGTRTLWNQHAYSVSNICDPRDSACDAGSYYGQIPLNQKKNWQLGWLNNFRQNVQDSGLFDAPDATVMMTAECTTPVQMEIQVRNIGLSGMPAGVQIDVFKLGSPEVLLGSLMTTKALLPGQTEVIPFVSANAGSSDTFQARIFVDPNAPTFNECRDDNNESPPVTPDCVG